VEGGTVGSVTPLRRAQPNAGQRWPHPGHALRSTHGSAPLEAGIRPSGPGDQVFPIPAPVLARGIRRVLPWASTRSSDQAEHANEVARSSPIDSFEELNSSSCRPPHSGGYPKTKIDVSLESLSHETRPQGPTQWQIPGIRQAREAPAAPRVSLESREGCRAWPAQPVGMPIPSAG